MFAFPTQGGLASKQDREDQNQPQTRARSTLDTRNAQDGDFRAGIKTKAKHDAKRVHLPRPVDDAEQLAKDIGHEAGTFEAQLSGRLVLLLLLLSGFVLVAPQQDAQSAYQLAQHPCVARAQEQQEGGADTSADDVADALEAVETIAQGAAGGGDDDAGDEHNGGVAQAEPGADADGALARGNQTAGHEVDGRNVVGVKGVAEAQGVGEDSRRDEPGVKAQDGAHDGPDDEVDGDEGRDLERDGPRQGAQSTEARHRDLWTTRKEEDEKIRKV